MEKLSDINLKPKVKKVKGKKKGVKKIKNKV